MIARPGRANDLPLVDPCGFTITVNLPNDRRSRYWKVPVAVVARIAEALEESHAEALAELQLRPAGPGSSRVMLADVLKLRFGHVELFFQFVHINPRQLDLPVGRRQHFLHPADVPDVVL